MTIDIKRLIFLTVDDLVTDFLYYDRKGDADLPRGAIEKAVKNREISRAEIIDRFTQAISEQLK